jgi:hypothetical protein
MEDLTAVSSMDAPSMQPRRARRGVAATRIGLAAIVIAASLSAPQLAEPAPVAAGSSCTGWTSQSVPPRTIRVLRTQSGRIEKVDFRRYVAEVMASGEWPGRLHQATLEAGAVATKQYAWYYAMRGHHRPGYRVGARCYDVRDDTMDQLYRPERAFPTVSQQRAIDATWALTLRKSGRFFLTGYRAGVSPQCAADANGWKLYGRSVEACARQGWSSRRVQRTYLGPNLTFVWSDRMGPLLDEPDIVLKRGSRLPDNPVTVTWKPEPWSPDVTRFTLQRRVGRGDWTAIPLAQSTARQTRVWLKTGKVNYFRVRGVDDQGRIGPWYYSTDLKAVLRGPVGRRLGAPAMAMTAHARQATASASSSRWVRTRFTGRSVALVASTGPGMGLVRIFVNGKRVALVDLHRESGSPRELVWTMNFDRVTSRSVAIASVDPSRPVDFRGFYVLR